jgi:hypothetical protein
MYSLTYKRPRDDENAQAVVQDGSRTLYLTDHTTEQEEDEKNFLKTINWEKLFNDFEFPKMNVRERAKMITGIMRHIVRRIPPLEEDLSKVYHFIVDEISSGRIKRQIISDNTLQVLPNDDQNSRCIRLMGQSGQGKSVWCGNYARNYHRIFPERDIYVFSFILDPDPAYEGIPIIKIPLNRQLVEECPEQDIREFEKSLVIFDDAENCNDKVLLKYIDSLRDRMHTMGRKLKINVLHCEHLTCNFKASRISLLESSAYVIFPSGSSRRNLKYLLDNYTNLSEEKVKHILNIRGSRWVFIRKSIPGMIISEHSCELV